jgi:uncharacterized membrane protein YbhN (UPF0104 family)
VLLLATPVIHAICLALVAADFVTRTWRTQCFLRALGQPLPFREVFIQSALGETASSLTPLRLGGEPARAWAMRRLGVPASAAIVCVGVEFVAMMAVVAAVAVGLTLTLAPQWWAAAGPELVRSALGGWPWLVGMVAAMGAAWWLVHVLAPSTAAALRREISAAREHARELGAWPYAASVPLTVLNVATRVAILPLLAVTLSSPPPPGATVVGSFALLYSQAILPTPAGAGAVELSFLGGAAGNLGSAEASLLVMWRIYTALLPVVLGLALGGHRYGWAVVPAQIRARLGIHVDHLARRVAPPSYDESGFDARRPRADDAA